MKFFKKIIIILVAISLLTLFIGCPPKPTEETIEEVTTTEEAELKTEEEAEETIIEPTEEIIVTTEAELERKYVSSLMTILSDLDESMENFSLALQIFAGTNPPFYRASIQVFINDIESIHEMYLKLKLPKRLEKVNDLFDKVMDHFLKCSSNFQLYLDTEDLDQGARYAEKALIENRLATECISKVTEELKRVVIEGK
ncbi:hypothetical protein ES703_13531 [subsurface metagenome]